MVKGMSLMVEFSGTNNPCWVFDDTSPKRKLLEHRLQAAMNELALQFQDKVAIECHYFDGTPEQASLVPVFHGFRS